MIVVDYQDGIGVGALGDLLAQRRTWRCDPSARHFVPSFSAGRVNS
jgi:hypothetical protein